MSFKLKENIPSHSIVARSIQLRSPMSSRAIYKSRRMMWTVVDGFARLRVIVFIYSYEKSATFGLRIYEQYKRFCLNH